MKLNGHLFLLFFISSLSIIRAQEIGFPIIRNYSPKEYNNAPQVWSAIQDKRGIMYFGTNSGSLLEYDGFYWRAVPIDNNASLYELASDKDGRIYVGASSEFGYLTSDKTGSTHYQTLMKLLNDTTYKIGDVRSIKFTSQYVYFLTYDAILQYAPQKETLSFFKADTSGRFMGDFVYNDTYYVRLSKKGLMKIEQSELKNAVQSDFLRTKITSV